MKYFVKETNNEVKLGETFKITNKKSNSLYDMTKIRVYKLNKETLPILLKMGILEERKEKSPYETLAVQCYANVISELKIEAKKLTDVLASIGDSYPAATFIIMLKEAGKLINNKYHTPLESCKDLYYISMLDGKIHKFNEVPKNIKYITVFRNYHDAKTALKILFPELYE